MTTTKGIGSLLFALFIVIAAGCKVRSQKAAHKDVEGIDEVAMSGRQYLALCSRAAEIKAGAKTRDDLESKYIVDACSSKLIVLMCVMNRDSILKAAAEISDEQSFVEAFDVLRSPEKKSIQNTADYVSKDIDSIFSKFKGEGQKSPEDLRQDISAAIAEKFTRDIEQCLESPEVSFKNSVERLKNDPEFNQSIANAGKAAVKSVLWSALSNSPIMATGAAAGAAQAAIVKSVKAKVAKEAQEKVLAKLNGSFLKMIGLSVCMTAADIASAFLSSSQDQAGDQCKALQNHTYVSTECMRTVANSCGAALGNVDIRSWGITSEDDLQNKLISTVNVGLSTACWVGGQAGKAAAATAVATGGTATPVAAAGAVLPAICGITNFALSQMNQTMRTGTNDMAECSGITKLFGCWGQRYGAGGWSNNEGVAQPRPVTGYDGKEWTVTDCCTCTQSFYDHFTSTFGPGITQKKFKSETYMSVIQNGDFATGNCGVQSKKGESYRRPEMVKDYSYRNTTKSYSDCRQITVLGPSCVGSTVDQKTYFVREWDVTARSPSEKTYSINRP